MSAELCFIVLVKQTGVTPAHGSSVTHFVLFSDSASEL